MHRSELHFEAARNALLRSKSRLFANVLRKKEGDSRLDLEQRVLQVRAIENDAVRAMGGVSFNTLMPGTLFAVGGLLFITRPNSHASRFVGGRFSPLSRREGPATPVLVMANMDVAEQNRGLLWIDEAIMYTEEDLKFDMLKGMTLDGAVLNETEDEVIFTTSEGRVFKLYHEQDCCEGVSVEEIHGDLEDIVGSKILLAEEVVSSDVPAKDPEWAESWTWTFYKIRTQKGDVTIRWYGQSNGYYSESVSFREYIL